MGKNNSEKKEKDEPALIRAIAFIQCAAMVIVSVLIIYLWIRRFSYSLLLCSLIVAVVPTFWWVVYWLALLIVCKVYGEKVPDSSSLFDYIDDAWEDDCK